MKPSSNPAKTHRSAIAAEGFLPDRGQRFLRALETTQSASDVWELIMDLGRQVGLPFVDFIMASDWRDRKQTQFIRTSYDATWLHALNTNPDVYQWSYFRSHGIKHLTPICVGLEFISDYHPLPEARDAVLRAAAARGMRAGLSIPLRHTAPPSAGMITFVGDHDRDTLLDILQRESWSLTVGAWAAYQRHLMHFSQEFLERNKVTEKQRELLERIGAGQPDRQIADALEISISAVRQTHEQPDGQDRHHQPIRTGRTRNVTWFGAGPPKPPERGASQSGSVQRARPREQHVTRVRPGAPRDRIRQSRPPPPSQSARVSGAWRLRR